MKPLCSTSLGNVALSTSSFPKNCLMLIDSIDFGLDQYALMAGLMRSMKGKAIVSVNDHSAMREAFADLSMKQLKIKYTASCGAAAELLIWNW